MLTHDALLSDYNFYVRAIAGLIVFAAIGGIFLSVLRKTALIWALTVLASGGAYYSYSNLQNIEEAMERAEIAEAYLPGIAPEEYADLSTEELLGAVASASEADLAPLLKFFQDINPSVAEELAQAGLDAALAITDPQRVRRAAKEFAAAHGIDLNASIRNGISSMKEQLNNEFRMHR